MGEGPKFKLNLLVKGGWYWKDTSAKELKQHLVHYIQNQMQYELRENDIEIEILSDKNDDKYDSREQSAQD
ncbi:MAG: hypothetical protein CL605_02170 [Altibacter sp.]|uniref:hypothetical protein n=1 Tax=Altibacter sp. TaxID=2024823 RepID=UPI000C8A4B3B|nr:hypothetical protein [Altibacter sp.]MAP53688.1 hypothetical protein [Altibacter sp.]|tara:strand:+ start:10983 stop:11195 length:213 start_codon:yes stop_codon:yes gene_type:complete